MVVLHVTRESLVLSRLFSMSLASPSFCHGRSLCHPRVPRSVVADLHVIREFVVLTRLVSNLRYLRISHSHAAVLHVTGECLALTPLLCTSPANLSLSCGRSALHLRFSSRVHTTGLHFTVNPESSSYSGALACSLSIRTCRISEVFIAC